MPKRRQEPEVTVKQLAPEPVDQQRTGSIYRPVDQLDAFPPGFKIEYVWFTPEMAREWVTNAESDSYFKQRPLRPSQVRRWRNLMTSERFVHFLPMASICEDSTGLGLNGMHRMTALAACPEGTKVGFMVIKDVPRWMFAFFDTNRVRTTRDMFSIAGMPSEGQTSSLMRLAMRYEEFLQGMIKPNGWRHWPQISDEPQDIVSFRQRRQELTDWYGIGTRLKHRTKLLIPATCVFAFYQTLAWPEGEAQVQEFLETLEDGEASTPQHPALVLRKWSLESYYESDQGLKFAKREAQLMLLFKQFAHVQKNSRQATMIWAFGQPMTMPYHPKGHEEAIKNVRIALDEIDREHADQ